MACSAWAYSLKHQYDCNTHARLGRQVSSMRTLGREESNRSGGIKNIHSGINLSEDKKNSCWINIL